MLPTSCRKRLAIETKSHRIVVQASEHNVVLYSFDSVEQGVNRGKRGGD